MRNLKEHCGVLQNAAKRLKTSWDQQDFVEPCELQEESCRILRDLVSPCGIL